MKALILMVVVLLSGCALTGNTGPVQMTCTDPATGNTFEFSLPMGSGRVYRANNDKPAIELGADHPCGPITIQSIEQGEDRSPGLLGLLLQFLGG